MDRLILILSLFFLVASPVLAEENRYSVSVANSPVIGFENAPVTIVEFIDYQ